jgi:hypothetical protein
MVLTPSSGMVWNNLGFQLVSSSGAALTPESQWGVFAYNSTSQPPEYFASYSFATGHWNGDSTALIVSGDAMSLFLGSTNLAGQGVHFVVTLSGACPAPTGSVSVTLP